MDSHFDSLLKQVLVDAGRITMKYFRQDPEAKAKPGFQGIVSIADLETEQFILSELQKKYPTHKIIAEESAAQSAKYSEGDLIWLIDPIDGTTNYVQGNFYFCISMALYEYRADGPRGIVGAVYQPLAEQLYFAEAGKGAYLNSIRLTMQDKPNPGQSCFGTGFSYNSKEGLRKVMDSIYAVRTLDPLTTVRINGAAALDISSTANSILNGFWEHNLSPWDMAAGALIVQEAGGVVTNFNGEPFHILRDRDIVCGPNKTHALLLKTIKNCF